MNESTVPAKTCNLCKEVKPATREFFYARSSAQGTWVARCKKCCDMTAKGMPPEQVNPSYVAPIVTRHDCPECGKSFAVSPAHLAQSPKSGIYCSRKCRHSDTRHVRFDPEKRRIQLLGKWGNGFFALVSPEDYDRVMTRRWNMNYKNYPILRRHEGEGTLALHRFILGVDASVAIDHIDGDPLNNQRENLRVCTYKENTYNRRKQKKPSSSQYKGVSLMRRTNRWHAEIKKDKKKYFLGCFKDEVSAGHAYDQKALELFGEFACLNFPVG